MVHCCCAGLERKHDLLTVMAGMSPVAHVSYGSQVLGTLLAAARAVGGGNGPASSKAERWPLACLRGERRFCMSSQWVAEETSICEGIPPKQCLHSRCDERVLSSLVCPSEPESLTYFSSPSLALGMHSPATQAAWPTLPEPSSNSGRRRLIPPPRLYCCCAPALFFPICK